jgi:2,3-bisphosphoglycerate-independent phosphoglycerate mutase
LPRVLLVFVDGVGLGEADAAHNPFAVARLPHLRALLDGRDITNDGVPFHGEGASLAGMDATLGVAGTPQSGTGQAALLTGANAVVMHGRHFGPWVPARLQRLVREESVLNRAQAAGHDVAFANAYPEEVLQLVVPGGQPGNVPSGAADAAAAGSAARRRARHVRRAPGYLRAGPPLAALGAGVLTRHTPELERGAAVASEITNDGWRRMLHRASVPDITAAAAGRNLAAIAAAHRLTLFAHYATDYAGHRRDMEGAVAALQRLDEFIGGLLTALPHDMLLIVASDHGNIEDVRTGHTRNPALGLVAGEGHALLSRRLQSLTDLAPALLDVLAL